MRRFSHPVALAVLIGLAGNCPASAADERDQMLKARTLYNQGQFDAAIEAADRARALPELADSADLIAARASL